MLDVTVARGRTTRPILSSVGFDIQLRMARFAAGSESTAVTVEIPAGPGTHSLADWAVFVETRRALLISILGSIYLDGIYPWIEQVPEIKEFPRGIRVRPGSRASTSREPSLKKRYIEELDSNCAARACGRAAERLKKRGSLGYADGGIGGRARRPYRYRFPALP